MGITPRPGFGLRWAQDRVRAFHTAAGQPAKDIPQLLDGERVALRARWMREEIDEFTSAQSVIDQADAMIDLIYFALGTLVEAGVDAETVFAVVHSANMQKFDAGALITGPDGKVEKPEGWASPEESIRAAIARNVTGLDLVTGLTSAEALAALAETLLTAAGFVIGEEARAAMASESTRGLANWTTPNDALSSAGLPRALRELPSDVITEATFHLVIDDGLANHPCIGITFDPARAYGCEGVPYSEAASIVRRIDNGVVVLDHGPASPGVSRLNIDRLYQAMRSAAGSVWIPETNTGGGQ